MSYFSPATDPKLYRCGCGRPECDAPPPDERLLVRLESVRAAYGSPMVVTSGPRCAVWNTHEGGEPDSAHLTGEAADIQCLHSWERFNLVQAALRTLVTRIGIGRDFVHLDVSRENVQYVLWTYYPKGGST